MSKLKNRVVFFHPMNDYTGSTRVLSTVIKDEYHDQLVTIVSNFSHEGSMSNLENVKRISYWAPEFRGRYIPVITTLVSRIHLFFIALCIGWKYDIFYINTFKPEYAAIVGWLYRKKIIYHIHEKYSKPNIGQKFSEYIFNHTKGTKIFVSEYIAKQYPHNAGSEYIIRYNKLSKDFLDNIQSRPISERKRNNILFVSSLVLQKGIDKLVPLAELLPEYTFTAVLSTDLYNIEDYFGKIVPRNLRLYAKQSNLHPFLRDADLLINLSNPSLVIETFGMTILEAMAYGIPAVVPNVGGPTELVKDGYNGYCVDTTKIENIKCAIEKSLSSENYQRLCENSKKQFENFK